MPMNQVKKSGNKDGGAGSIVYIHAKIQTGETKARITDLDGNLEDIRVSLESLPAFPKLPNKFVLEECALIYDTEKEEVLSINPYSGEFLAVGLKLGPNTDGEDGVVKAEEKEKMGKDKKPYTILQFYEIFKIVDKTKEDGVFYGSTPRAYLHDRFSEDGRGMVGYWGDPAKSVWSDRLVKFCVSQDLAVDLDWPKDGNVLPLLDEMIQENEPYVSLYFDKGFVNSITKARKPGKVKEVEVDLDVEDEPVDDEPVKVKRSEKELKAEMGIDSVDEEFPKAKAAKKPVKKVKAADDDSDL